MEVLLDFFSSLPPAMLDNCGFFFSFPFSPPWTDRTPQIYFSFRSLRRVFPLFLSLSEAFFLVFLFFNHPDFSKYIFQQSGEGLSSSPPHIG